MVTLRQRAFVPVLLCASSTAAIVSSLGAPLIPRLAQQLRVSISSAQWTLTVTLVVGAVLSALVGGAFVGGVLLLTRSANPRLPNDKGRPNRYNEPPQRRGQ